MENASKALLIAGAILLALLLISLGILIFSQAQSVTDGEQLSQEEVKTFNSELLKYEGEDKTGTVVKDLISAVKAINGSKNNKARGVSVSLTLKKSGEADNTSPSTSDINAAQRYTVECSDYADDGRIKTITITPDGYTGGGEGGGTT